MSVQGNNTDRDEDCADDGVAMTVDSATLAAPTDAHTIIIASKLLTVFLLITFHSFLRCSLFVDRTVVIQIYGRVLNEMF